MPDAEVESAPAAAPAADAASSSAAAAPAAPAPAPAVAKYDPPFVPHQDMQVTWSSKGVDMSSRYCPIDGMPADYSECEMVGGKKFAMCLPWIAENCPEYYPEKFAAGGDKDAMKKAADAKTKEMDKVAAQKAAAAGGGAGKAKGKEASKEVLISVAKRQGRKMTTTILGLDLFGVDNKLAAKLMKKKFACGCAKQDAEPGKPECVEVQGDPGEDAVVELIMKEFGSKPEFKEAGLTKKVIKFEDKSGRGDK